MDTNASQLVANYDAWNRAIYEHFFGPSKSDADVRLTFDDVAAAQIADKIDKPIEQFVECIRALLRPDLRDVFLRFRELSWRRGDFPRTLGLLAAQVLVASRMASDSDFTAQAFWPRFNSLLLCSGDSVQPGGYEYLRACWLEAGRFFNEEMRGSLGYLRLPIDEYAAPLVNRNHINYPLSQCLVRDVDRRDLAEFFVEHAYASHCDENEVLSVISDSIYAFGKSFASVVQQAQSNRAFASELTRIILEIRIQVGRSVPGADARAGRRTHTRLRFSQRRSSFILSLQEKLDDWRLVCELDADQWYRGVSDDRGDSIWPGAELTAFIETADGFVTSRSRVAADVSRVRILLHPNGLVAIKKILDKAGREYKEIDITSGLDGLNCIQFGVNPEEDGALLERFGLRSGPTTRIRLEGGLTIGERCFIAGAVPRITIDGRWIAEIVINGTSFAVDEDGSVPHPTEPGQYLIEAADKRLAYSIVDLSSCADSSEGCEVGYIIGARPPVMRTEDLNAVITLAMGTYTLVGAEMYS